MNRAAVSKPLTGHAPCPANTGHSAFPNPDETWDRDEIDQLFPLVYEQLRAMAHFYLHREEGDITLQPTMLIHEVYLRLRGSSTLQFQNRSQFFWFAGRLMRRILVEHARKRLAEKRGGGEPPGALILASPADGRGDLDFHMLVGLDRALTDLCQIDPRQGKIVELRFFAGLEIRELAKLLEISTATVNRELRMAKRWLALALAGNPV